MILASRIAAVSVVLILLIAMTLVTFPEAQAEEREIEEASVVQTYVVAGGLGGFLIMLSGLALLVLIPIGAIKVKKENAWPHWRRLVRGLGEAALLLGIISAFGGLIDAFRVIAMMGATVTPADLAGGMSRAMAPVHAGALVALLGLIGSGIIRTLSPADSPS